MSKFTVRVELRDATTWSTYEKLHSAMEREGFSRTITSGDGKVYQLPDAEYNMEAEITARAVLDAASRAASTTGHKFSVLVTESAGRTWDNLLPVNAAI